MDSQHANMLAAVLRKREALGIADASGTSLPSTRASSSDSLLDLAKSRQASAPAATSRPWWAGLALSKRGRSALVAALGAALLLWWTRRITRASLSASKFGPGRLGFLASSALVALARLLGVTSRSDIVDKPPHVEAIEGRQVLACWHPHGLYTMTPLFFHSDGPRNQKSPTYSFFTAVAGACFKFPIFREILLLVSCRVADKSVIDKLLQAGKSVFVCPGGIHEQLETDPNQERVFFPPNLGFIRQAIANGVPLVPTYNFGENQLYDVPAWSRKASWWLKDRFGVGIPLGVGRWGVPFLPHRQRISIRVGKAIEVGEADSQATEARVQTVFQHYCLELRRLFDEHKATDLPPQIAAKGLELIWRGHEAEDLSLDALLAATAAAQDSADADRGSRGQPEPTRTDRGAPKSRL